MARFDDAGHRWREDELAALSPAAARALLLADARELAAADEPELAYGILRELVWRFDDCDQGWQLLAQMALRLGHADEAEAAERVASERKSPSP